MKKVRKSMKIVIVFLLYVTAMTFYLLPRNSELSLTEKIVTVTLSYVVVFLLWLVLRKREKMRDNHNNE